MNKERQSMCLLDVKKISSIQRSNGQMVENLLKHIVNSRISTVAFMPNQTQQRTFCSRSRISSICLVSIHSHSLWRVETWGHILELCVAFKCAHHHHRLGRGGIQHCVCIDGNMVLVTSTWMLGNKCMGEQNAWSGESRSFMPMLGKNVEISKKRRRRRNVCMCVFSLGVCVRSWVQVLHSTRSRELARFKVIHVRCPGYREEKEGHLSEYKESVTKF